MAIFVKEKSANQIILFPAKFTETEKRNAHHKSPIVLAFRVVNLYAPTLLAILDAISPLQDYIIQLILSQNIDQIYGLR